MAYWKQSLMAGVAIMAMQAAPAWAEGSGLDNWDIDFQNTLRHDNYTIDGAATGSPWPFNGGHSYNEMNLNMSRQFSPYERFRANFFGIVNDSDYRGVDDGIVPERMNLFYENGEQAVPYRVQAGDYYAGVSYRTLQRTLKGASVEVQPFGTRERQHSILFFSGANQPTWRSFDASDDYYNGASWLIEDRNWGRFSFNIVHASQDEPTGMLFGSDNDQMLYSAAAEVPFIFLNQQMTFEAEQAFFDGDYGTTKDEADWGSFAQLAGRSRALPLDYRLRYERYGTDYRPNGAIITPDRQSYEAHAGWRFDSGLYLRGRAQKFEDSFDSTNQLDTEVLGVNLSGPMFASWTDGLTGSFDTFIQQLDNDFDTVDIDSKNVNATLTKPIWRDYTGQVTLYLQETDDRTLSNFDSETQQLGLGFYKPIAIGDFSGTINPGIAIRETEFAGVDSVELHPTINLTLADDMHRISANYGWLNQNRISAAAVDVATQTAGLDYSYIWNQHELGTNLAYYERDLNTGLDTDAYRVGVYWTYRFYKPAGSDSNYQSGATTLAGMGGNQMLPPELTLSGLSLVEDLAPGEQLVRASLLIGEQGISEPVKLSGIDAYEVSLLPEVVERQRLVVAHDKGEVTKTGLVIDITDTGSPRSVEQFYERVKEKLVRQYGQPVNIYERGEFTGNPVADINSERVIRAVEWETANGALRYGIPRRLDGQIRLELQHAPRFKSPRDTLWSMEVY